MQVSHQADHISQVVINKSEVMDFGISSSAEFFHILSSTLYSDQILAVVREVLCNAWDAHIDAGVTHTPIEVTLENNVFTIRDFGKGIAHADIQRIYGVYGLSPKTHDGNQTGGFGLGSKSPFAYTDHFEVVSRHNGTKTIYSMVKASLDAGGKPGIVTIAQLPTDETGLSVSIDIKSQNDADRFTDLVHRIAANGEMNVLFNGEKIPTIPFSQAKHGYLITNQPVLENHCTVCLRYGSVIYPIEFHDAYREEMHQVIKLIEMVSGPYYSRGERTSIIFQAPPHSVSVTPSRESLSLQEHTIATITRVFNDFLRNKKEEIEQECLNIVDNMVVNHIQQKNHHAVLVHKPYEPLIPVHVDERTKRFVITDIKAFAKRHSELRYPDIPGFRKKDLQLRLNALIAEGIPNRGMLQVFKRDLSRNLTTSQRTTWLQRNIARKLIRDITNEPMLSLDRLRVHDTRSNGYYTSNEGKGVPISEFKSTGIDSYLPFLRNIVVLTHNRDSVGERLPKFPQMKDDELCTGFLLYTVPRVAARIQAARAFFQKQGYTVLDLTIHHAWETVDAVAPIPKPVAKTRKNVGIPLLSETIRSDGGYYPRSLRDRPADSLRRIEHPEFIVRYEGTDEWLSGGFSGFHPSIAKEIVTVFGDRGGVVMSSSQAESYIKKGAKNARDFIEEIVSKEIRTNPRIKSALINSHYLAKEVMYDIEKRSTVSHAVIETLYGSEPILKKYKIFVELTETEKLYLRIWYSIHSYRSIYTSRLYMPDYVKETIDYVLSLKPSAANKKFYTQVSTSKYLNMFYRHSIQEAVTRMNQNPNEENGFMKVLSAALTAD